MTTTELHAVTTVCPICHGGLRYGTFGPRCDECELDFEDDRSTP